MLCEQPAQRRLYRPLHVPSPVKRGGRPTHIQAHREQGQTPALSSHHARHGQKTVPCILRTQNHFWPISTAWPGLACFLGSSHVSSAKDQHLWEMQWYMKWRKQNPSSSLLRQGSVFSPQSRLTFIHLKGSFGHTANSPIHLPLPLEDTTELPCSHSRHLRDSAAILHMELLWQPQPPTECQAEKQGNTE